METYQGCKSVLNSSELVIAKSIQLKSGAFMPIVGFGTFRIRGKDTIFNCLDAALKAGYRLFDTASVYGNEADIGDALKKLLPKYDLKRENIFVVSKLSPSDQGEHAEKAIKESLRRLDLQYLDLFLIHWPGASHIDVKSQKNFQLRLRSWIAFEKFYNNGLLKSIGVSNYTTKHLTELLQSCSVQPAVNQVEFHPYFKQPAELYEVCQKNGIILQAYSSLGGSDNNSLLLDPSIVSVADKLKKSPAQVLLRWGLQAGYSIIPKSTNPERIYENSLLDFALSDADFNAIKNINTIKKYAWDPEVVL